MEKKKISVVCDLLSPSSDLCGIQVKNEEKTWQMVDQAQLSEPLSGFHSCLQV